MTKKIRRNNDYIRLVSFLSGTDLKIIVGLVKSKLN
jgi:hypothetical protein